MIVDLRWVVPAHTTTAKPVLQFRTPQTGLWVTVPTVVEPSEPGFYDCVVVNTPGTGAMSDDT
jgi:hypothetical protein